jgi:hypothetical protein
MQLKKIDELFVEYTDGLNIFSLQPLQLRQANQFLSVLLENAAGVIISISFHANRDHRQACLPTRRPCPGSCLHDASGNCRSLQEERMGFFWHSLQTRPSRFLFAEEWRRLELDQSSRSTGFDQALSSSRVLSCVRAPVQPWYEKTQWHLSVETEANPEYVGSIWGLFKIKLENWARKDAKQAVQAQAQSETTKTRRDLSLLL